MVGLHEDLHDYVNFLLNMNEIMNDLIYIINSSV